MLSAIYGNLVARTGLCLITSGLLMAGPAMAQSDADMPAEYSTAELEELVAPVALYPDDLLAIILPASAYPLQIVQAARYLEGYEKNPDLEPSDDWDDSVVALLNYPEIIELMNQDLDWTWQLGEAVVNQQPDVLDAVQRFRDRAYLAGNLSTDERQIVSNDDGVIEIEPVDPEVIYVPYYEPERVIVYQPRPVYYYYPRPYPVYYYPYTTDYWFASRLFWGVTTFYTLAWLSDGLHLHHHYHDSHPYHRRTYRTHHYVRHHHHYSSHDVYVNRGHRSRYDGSDRTRYDRRYRGDAWRPKARHGARPGYRRHKRHREPSAASAFSTTRLRDDATRRFDRTRDTRRWAAHETDRRAPLRSDRGAVKRSGTVSKRTRQTAIARTETRSIQTRVKSKNVERQKRIQVRQTEPASRSAKASSNLRVAQNTMALSRPASKRSQPTVKRSGPRQPTSSPPKQGKRIAKIPTRKGRPAKNKALSKDRRAKR